MIYEWREYEAAEGKEKALHQRFQEYTLPIFSKHGINVVGFWTKKEDSSKISYLCKFENQESLEKAWASFANDEEWKQVKVESERNGPLTIKMTSNFLLPVDYIHSL